METFYLIDFENVHNDGIKNIGGLTRQEHVHIFSTQNALNIKSNFFWMYEDIDIHPHVVPARKQSVDMHLVSYLGHLLCMYGKQCSYVIISKDKDYVNIIDFWKKEGYSNISIEPAIPPKKIKQSVSAVRAVSTQTLNNKINAGMNYDFSGDDRSELNLFMQHGLVNIGYDSKTANRICKYVVAHCNDDRILSNIHNDLKDEFEDYVEMYEDVKSILAEFVTSKSKTAKREAQVRSFFGRYFKKKIYTDNKEEIISIILNAKTRQEVNNGLMKIYADGNAVKHIYQTVQPLIKELPGR